MHDRPHNWSAGPEAVAPPSASDRSSPTLPTMESLRLPPLRFASHHHSSELNFALPSVTPPPPRMSPTNTAPWWTPSRLPSPSAISPVPPHDPSYSFSGKLEEASFSPVISPVSQTPSSTLRSLPLVPAFPAPSTGPALPSYGSHLRMEAGAAVPVTQPQSERYAFRGTAQNPSASSRTDHVDVRENGALDLQWQYGPSSTQSTATHAAPLSVVPAPPQAATEPWQGAASYASAPHATPALPLRQTDADRDLPLVLAPTDVNGPFNAASLQLVVKSPVKKTVRTSRGVRDVYACPYANCARVSTEQSNMKAHMRMHTGEKPYVCRNPGCLKAFRWKSSLTYHEKALHVKTRPFKCSPCRRSFVEKRKLRMHFDLCPAMKMKREQQDRGGGNGGAS